MRIFGISKLPVSKVFPSVEEAVKNTGPRVSVITKKVHPERNQSIPAENRFGFKTIKGIVNRLFHK